MKRSDLAKLKKKYGRIRKMLFKSGFKRGVKSLRAAHKTNELDKLKTILEEISTFDVYDGKYKNHPLKRNKSKDSLVEELHISGDTLLLWGYDEHQNEAYVDSILIDIQNHNNLSNTNSGDVVGELSIKDVSKLGESMELDESLFEDQERVVDDILQYKREIDSQTDLENAIANLEVGEEELVLRMRTTIPGLTDNDFDTLHIIKRTPEWYKMWLTDGDGNVANDNNFSTYDNTLYWATLAMQGGEQAEETVESIEESATNGKKLEEASTSRIYSHLTQDENWAIISPYNTDKYSRKQNQGRMNKLRSIVQKDYGLGYNQFLSKWVYEDEDGNTVSTDEESLLIPQMTKAQAMKLGKDFEQSTIIVNDKDGCREICTTAFGPYNVGDVVRTYDLSGNTPMNIEHAEEIFANRTVGPVSKAIKGGKPFHLSEVYKVELPRASYFQMEPTYTKIYERLDPTPDPIGEELEETKFIEEPTEEMVSKDYQNQLITLINGEWDTIQDYNELVNNLIASANEKYLELVPIIEGIIKDEHNHIGNLQVALTKLNPESDPEIDKGGEEAEDILKSEN